MSLTTGRYLPPQAPIAEEPGTVVGDPTLGMDLNGNLYLAYFGYDPSRGGIAHFGGHPQ